MVKNAVSLLVGLLFCCVLGLTIQSSIASAEVVPGDILTIDNIGEKAKGLFPPSHLEWLKGYGKDLRIEVVETKHFTYSKGYREATEKYLGQVKLTPDGELLNWVAGQPFPEIDPGEPRAGVKVAWNFEKAYVGDDHYTAGWVIPIIDKQGNTRVIGASKYGWSVYKVSGRTDIPPIPEITPNPEGISHYTLIFIDKPYDIRGLGNLQIRYNDPKRRDDTYAYIPGLRRIRRLSAGQRGDAMFGSDMCLDDIHGYSGRIGENTYKLLGEQVILACTQPTYPEGVPFPMGFNVGRVMGMRDIWDKRPCWVLEFISKDPRYVYSKRIVWIDKECYHILYQEIYDRRGDLWKINQRWKNRSPWGGIEIAEDNCLLQHDLLSGSTTIGQLWGTRYNTNMPRSVFSLGAMSLRAR